MNGARHAGLFLDMLAAERGAARNTLDAYERDIGDYLEFLGSRSLGETGPEQIRDWLADIAARGLKASSSARRPTPSSAPPAAAPAA